MHVFPDAIYFRYATFVAEGLSLFANTLVVYLALTETNKDLLQYRSILLFNCLVDYVCTIVNLTNQAHLEFMDELWIQVFEGPSKYLPRNTLILMTGSHSFMIGLGIIALPIQFFYRWFLIKTGRRLSNMQLICLLLVSFMGAFYFWCNLSGCFYVSDWKFKDHSFMHKNPYIFNEYNLSPVLVVAELKTGPMILHTTMSCLCTLFTALLIWFFSVDTYLTLKKSGHTMHENTKKLQQQMNRMLFVQTAAVFVSIIIPVSLHLTMMVFDLKLHGLGTCANLFISFMPTLNPICTMILVTRLRDRAIRLFCCGKRGQIHADLSTSVVA